MINPIKKANDSSRQRNGDMPQLGLATAIVYKAKIFGDKKKYLAQKQVSVSYTIEISPLV
jgi:hypothetical protein